jgi:hypothetical protein
MRRVTKNFATHPMSVVRHFAFNMLRAVNDKRSLKLRRNKAARNQTYMASILGKPC